MESFSCYDNSDVIATLVMTNFHLKTTVVAIFPNVCLWRHSLCSDLVLTLKNCTEPPSYATTAYVVAIWPSLLVDSFVKIWATYEMFLGKWFTAPPPPAKNFPYAYGNFKPEFLLNGKRPITFLLFLIPVMFIFIVCKLLLHLKCLKHTET